MKLLVGLRRPKPKPLPERQQIKAAQVALKSARAELKNVSKLNVVRRQDIRIKILVLETHIAELRGQIARKSKAK